MPWGRGHAEPPGGPECIRLRLHPHSVRGQVPRAGPREGAISPSLAGGQLGPKPQVTGVIGVSDPYSVRCWLSTLEWRVGRRAVAEDRAIVDQAPYVCSRIRSTPSEWATTNTASSGAAACSIAVGSVASRFGRPHLGAIRGRRPSTPTIEFPTWDGCSAARLPLGLRS
jgi:hypothetical protein